MMNSNIGWLYYKYYYEGLVWRKPDFQGKLALLKQARIHEVVPKVGCGFILETIYPGLLIGSGAAHESGGTDKDNELKLGLSFDYTTGLPVIPGSSLKGLLRSMFPLSVKKGKTKEEEAELEKSYRTPRREYIRSILNKGDELDVDLLEKVIFEGIDVNGKEADGYLPIYERDIFFDAFPTRSAKCLLDNDYITPHIIDGDPMSVFKNPTPIQFIKVLSGVKFEFRFDLKPTRIGGIEITAENKEKLFKEILTTVGIGAKTNVGYGQFTDKLSLDIEDVSYKINADQPVKKKLVKRVIR